MKIYIAGPFFNPQQIEVIETIKRGIKMINKAHGKNITYYSPKDDNLYTPGGDIPPSKCFDDNLKNIIDSQLLIAITTNLDAGTLFEAGYAFNSGIPIVYFWPDHNNRKFNLMLSESASYIAYDFNDLMGAIYGYEVFNLFPDFHTPGELE